MLWKEEKSHEKNEMEAAGGICAGSPAVCGSGTCHSTGAGVRIGGIGILRQDPAGKNRKVPDGKLYH